MESRSDNTPLVVLVGETASGKSALAMELARRFDGEIINADSWAVYRDFDIGTAKPSALDCSHVPHHLINVANPSKGFSAAEYKRLALATIADITSRAKLPILAGGTGLYIDSVIFDYSFLPPAAPEVRAAFNKLSIGELLQKAAEADIDTIDIDIRNKRRIIRLLETGGALAKRHELRKDTLIIGLSVPRDALLERVTRRVDVMLDAGLEQEVAKLSERYGWDAEPMKGIGYREFYDYFNGAQTLDQTRQRIISATMNLAKRQRTWFKRNNGIHWISKQAEAVELITTLLNK